MQTMSDVTIPASDGVNLVGDVYLPGDGKQRHPAVVDMEPYGRSSSTDYVPEGYARVNTDVRGSGKSGGALCLLCLREQQDVYDVVEWIAHQPWSDGHVALYGYSYSAITSLLGAALRPPHLDAVVVGHPPTDPYRDVLWHNGLYDQGFVGQWFAGQTAAQSVGAGPQPQVLDRAQQQFAIETRRTRWRRGIACASGWVPPTPRRTNRSRSPGATSSSTTATTRRGCCSARACPSCAAAPVPRAALPRRPRRERRPPAAVARASPSACPAGCAASASPSAGGARAFATGAGAPT